MAKQDKVGRLYVDDEGRGGGLPVVFLHSFAGSGRHWAAQLAHLRHKRRAVTIDLPGHGWSGKPEKVEAYAVPAMADEVARTIDGLKLGRFVLVGHSLGGAVAASYAGAHPDEVAGLVLVGTPGKAAPEQAQGVIEAMTKDYDGVAQQYWDKLLSSALPWVKTQIAGEVGSVPNDVGLQLIKSVFAFDPLPPLRAFRGPKLAIITEHNNQPNDLHMTVPDLPHRLIEGTSHWPQMDKPEVFNAILDASLRSLEEATARRGTAHDERVMGNRF